MVEIVNVWVDIDFQVACRVCYTILLEYILLVSESFIICFLFDSIKSDVQSHVFERSNETDNKLFDLVL